MNGNLSKRSEKKYAVLDRLSKVLLSLVALDAAYVYGIVERMRESVGFALARYYAVPLMTEHLLAAVTAYLACMVLIDRVDGASRT